MTSDERQLDRMVSNQDGIIASVSVTTWDDRGEEFIEAVKKAIEEVYLE